MSTFAKKVFMARMVRELELLNYDATMARCSNSALKLVIWWGNNIGGGTMLISEAELKESVELAIAYWKKQIVLFEMCFHKLIPTAKGCNMPRIFISFNQLLQISILLHF